MAMTRTPSLRTPGLLAALCAALFLGGCVSADSDAEAAPTLAEASQTSAASPILEVRDAEALVQSLSGLDARLLVVNFWATWCMPCRAEFPDLMRYRDAAEAEGVLVRFVSVDSPQDLALVRRFLDEQAVQDPSYIHTGRTDVIRDLNSYAAGAVPVTMIMDGEGRVRDTHMGMITFEELAARVNFVLSEMGEEPVVRS